jgi:DNA repair protein RadC
MKSYTGTSYTEEPKGKKITSSDEVATEIRELIGQDIERKEFFCLITLDGASNIINSRIIHIGTLNQSLVHPREVFNPTLIDNSAGIIIAHNHPSGTLKPSHSDIQVTQRLEEVSKLVGIELLDHVIVTKLGFYSFADKELL